MSHVPTTAIRTAAPLQSPAPDPAPLGIGVVGAGYWGPRLIRNFEANPGSRVRAVCDLDPNRLSSVTRTAPDLFGTTRLEELLARSDIDAVAVATPVGSHYEIARRVLESGRSVLVEKPLAASVAEAEALIELADRRGLTLGVDHTFLYHPAVRKAAEIARNGELGRLLYFDSVRINLGLFQPDIDVLWDLAPHDLSILDFLHQDRPEAVTAVGASHWNKGTANIAYMTLTYPDSFIAHLHVSWLAPVKVRQTILSGDRKMLIYDDNQVMEKIKVYDRGIVDVSDPELVHQQLVNYRSGDMRAPHLAQDEPLALEVADFLQSVRNGTRPVSGGLEGLSVVRVLEKAQQSMRLGGVPVPLDEV